ncbi:hypothetical protein [Streptomyces sp. NPDC086777]|uniref:hypothetical protein n=1 Tax=Streptomyces sp. NPDC086777 TaxID=3154866 RepID=UPI00345032A9
MAYRRAPWWWWPCTALSFLVGGFVIVTSLLDPGPWWSWSPHLLLSAILIADAGFLCTEARRKRQRGGKKRPLPPL